MQLTLTKCPHQLLQVRRVRHNNILLLLEDYDQTNKYLHAVPASSPQRDEGSQVEGELNHPHTSEVNSRMGTEPQPQHGNEKASDQSNVFSFPPFVGEIISLRDRLAHLEDQAAQQWLATVEDGPSENIESGQEPKKSLSDDEKVLRKNIRKARSGRQQVERIEKKAEEEADERNDYGQSPNKPMAGIGGATSTMFHIEPSGDLKPGGEANVVYGKGGWFNTHPHGRLGHFEHLRFRQLNKPFPHRGVRPPTAIHPFYERQTRNEGVHPPRLSRKLGPPTRWDESDSGEWSSDTSTRSQDFKYFRARLRGDFEWELDRLNAQVMRYKKHQEKKRSHQLAIQAQKSKEDRREAFGALGQHDAFVENLEFDNVGSGKDKNGIRQLNPLGWSAFMLRLVPGVIDVLMEEPKLASDIKPWGKSRKIMKEKKPHKKELNLGAPTVKDTRSKDDAAQGLNQSTSWTARDPLPERIRINSTQIIDALSKIHGSRLCMDANESASVAILRPFKILHAYDKDIREICLRLEHDAADEPKTGGVEGLDNEQIKSTISADEKLIEKTADAENKTRDEEEKPSSREERDLRLEHLNCLREFMDEFIGKKVSYLNSVACSKIFFSDVWHLFQPGTSVISADGKQAYLVVSLKSKRHKGADRWDAFWTQKGEKRRRRRDSSDESDNDDTRAEITVKCVFIHFDGESFGPVIRTFHINKWDGEKEVTYLDIYPFRFHILKHLDKRPLASNSKTSASFREEELEKGVKSLRQKLVDRGRVFVDVASVKQMYYSGLAVDTRDEIESQVMVDFEEALADEARKDWIPKITRLVGNDWNSKTVEADEGCTAECCWQENVHDDAYVETNNTEKLIDDMMAEIKDIPHKLPSAIIYPRTLGETKTESNALTDDELMIMSYSVFGFVLRDRTWGKFSQRWSSVDRTQWWNGLTYNLNRVAKLDLDCMSGVRSPGNATEQTDDDLEEGGRGAFGQLVLPPGHKKMVLSLISQHFRSKESQEGHDKQADIVRGKGKLCYAIN